MPEPTSPLFFESAEEFRAWLEVHHDTRTEVWVGYHRKATGRPTMTWSDSVDEALCFGWIDGIRKRLDDERYVMRFTPRKPGSNWSRINLQKMEELTRAGRVRPAGRKAFEQRDPAKSDQYSFEQRDAPRLDEAGEAAFRANEAAWRFFEAQPPGYRRVATWWVLSAKRPETRARRLATLIDDSAAGRRIPLLRRPGESGP